VVVKEYPVSYEGDAYEAFREGTSLLESDNAHAAVIRLERARSLEPEQGSVREALARAYYRTGRFSAAEEEFKAALEIDPVNDYAHFGIGLCRLKAGDRRGARGHLRQAAVMRPDNPDYRAALDNAREPEDS
jgi:Flp pilus assembly protein TadD